MCVSPEPPSSPDWSQIVYAVCDRLFGLEGVSWVSFAFWAWIVVAVVCALGECITGGLLTLPWAVGAFIAALLEASGISSGWQWIAFVLVSSILLVAGQRLLVRRQSKDEE